MTPQPATSSTSLGAVLAGLLKALVRPLLARLRPLWWRLLGPVPLQATDHCLTGLQKMLDQIDQRLPEDLETTLDGMVREQARLRRELERLHQAVRERQQPVEV